MTRELSLTGSDPNVSMFPPAPQIELTIDKLPLIGGLIAAAAHPGTVVALRGDLGAGKTSLARYIVRALTGDASAEVSSPTYPIVQTYAAPSFEVAHFDFYRLSGAADLDETGYRDFLPSSVVLIEWPERAEAALPLDRIEVSITEGRTSDSRTFALSGTGAFEKAARRLSEMIGFVVDSGWGDAAVACVHGDASSRRYFRLQRGMRSVLLMDVPARTDGPRIYGGMSYGEVAHLAEDVRPFAAIAAALREAGIATPVILARDLDLGLMVIEDFGDDVFGALVERGGDQEALWRSGVDTLVHLHLHGSRPTELLEVGEGAPHRMQRYDRGALEIETNLLLQWYWPRVVGHECPDNIRAEFAAAWDGLFQRLLNLPVGWVLRDFHSPNLIRVPGRTGIAQVGVIDFQDAVIGHHAYDLVSLLQDARVDVDSRLEDRLLDHYCREMAAGDPDFDRDTFAFAYALLGVQRNTKILGIFARLALRDGKSQYLKHIPRIWQYLERDLAVEGLGPISRWYDRHLPGHFRIWPSN